MPLAAGTRLGPYEVLAAIGAGSMGEVYRARDTKLHRDVALKVLPNAVAHDADRLARFQREARILASLNHPHIAQIHGLEESYPITALVMELVEGPTLADRIAQGSMRVEEALPIAQQIAEALEAAHEQGIVHRDLKPANVKVTRDGQVKVLDFGLAKAFTGPPGDALISNSPTLSLAGTQPGVMLGTAAYMSPEQAKGFPADRRSDVFSFGCVLYEMLAGRQAFQGETAGDVLASVLVRDVDLTRLPQGLSARLYDLLRRCLDKSPTRRWQAMGDLRFELEAAQSDPYAPDGWAAAAVARPHGRERLAWAVAAVAVLSAIALGMAGLRSAGDVPAAPLIRFLVSVPPMPTPAQAGVSVSPDGRKVAFVASEGGTSVLFVRSIDSLTAQALAGTEGAVYPFWSPDSRYIGFGAGGTLKKVAATGGPPQLLCNLGMSGGTWNSDGIVVFSSGGRLHRVSDAGGVPVPMPAPDESLGETAHLWPYFLPDGSRFLYLAWSAEPAIYAGSLDSEERTRILTAASMPVFAPPGFLLFQRAGTLLAQRFDARKLVFTEEPVRLGEGIPFSSQNGRAPFAASQSGALVFLSEEHASQQFTLTDRSGQSRISVGEPGRYASNFALSPDGDTIAVALIDVTGKRDLWLLEWARGVLTRFTFDGTVEAGGGVIWSPDGGQLAFNSVRTGIRSIALRNANGAPEETTVVDAPEAGINPPAVEDWSKDGRHIVYKYDNDLWIHPLSSGQEPFPIVQEPGDQDEARFSFDGRWLAYASDESGRWEVYVTSFPAGDQKRRVSTNGGSQPQWRRDGKELYYLALDGTMMAVEMVTDSRIGAGVPFELFDAGIVTDPLRDQYMAIPDGQRFLIQTPMGAPPITVVLNWPSALR